MKIEEGRLYFIKDEFLEKYGKQYNLMNNKEYCFNIYKSS